MDGGRFDAMTRTLAGRISSRRRVLGGLASGALGLALTRRGRGGDGRVAAKEKEPDGCVSVDRPCRRDRQCCSGICKGPRGKETCRAHGVGTCKPGQDACGPEMQIARCNGSAACGCFVTTGGARFCAADEGGDCAGCRTDRDCEEQGFGSGAACVICREECGGRGTACVRPCGSG